MKLKHGMLLGAAAAGAALALYAHNKENREPDRAGSISPAEAPEYHGRSVSLLLDSQRNMEQVTRENLRTWFVENTDSQTSGKVMIVAEMCDTVLVSVGYEMDIVLDRDHYLLLQIRDRDSLDCPKECLVNFVEMEPELKELLDNGRGILKVNS